MLAAFTWAGKQNLPCAQKFVLMTMADMCGMEFTCHPSYAYLARQCGLSRQHVIRVISELEKAGFIAVRQRTSEDGSFRSSEYHILVPEEIRNREVVLDRPITGCIYIAVSEGFTKVGVTRELETRIRTLNNASHADVQLFKYFDMPMVEARKIEESVKFALDGKRAKGEWFMEPPDSVAAMIESLILGGVVTPCDHPPSNTVLPPLVTPVDHGVVTQGDQVVTPCDLESKSKTNNPLTRARACEGHETDGAKSPIPEDWQPDHICVTRLTMSGCPPHTPDQVQTFVAHHRSVGTLATPEQWGWKFVKWCLKDKMFTKQLESSGIRRGGPKPTSRMTDDELLSEAKRLGVSTYGRSWPELRRAVQDKLEKAADAQKVAK